MIRSHFIEDYAKSIGLEAETYVREIHQAVYTTVHFSDRAWLAFEVVPYHLGGTLFRSLGGDMPFENDDVAKAFAISQIQGAKLAAESVNAQFEPFRKWFHFYTLDMRALGFAYVMPWLNNEQCESYKVTPWDNVTEQVIKPLAVDCREDLEFDFDEDEKRWRREFSDAVLGAKP